MIKYLALASVLACGCRSPLSTEPSSSLADFRADLDGLRLAGHVESISAVIVKDQAIVWSASLGAASVTDTTVFHLASLTKPLASTLLLQLVDEGKVSLDDPVSKYGIVLTSPGTVLVRHLVSHTSEGVPGSHYAYNGDRFSLLDSVIRRAAGRSFAAAVQERIIARLGLTHIAPTPQSAAFAESGLDRATYLATPVSGPGGEVFPYGLGWFATDYKGVRIIWHYGYWTASSTLVIKVPARNLTFILLANTDGLSAPYPLGAGKLDASPWARAFLETFVIAGLPPG